MSILSKNDFSTSKQFLEAVESVANSNIDPKINTDVITENEDSVVHIEGYGKMHLENAKNEAHISSKMANVAAEAGDHRKATYYHQRAAMFHGAIQQHLERQRGPNPIRLNHVGEAVDVSNQHFGKSEGNALPALKTIAGQKLRLLGRDPKGKKWTDIEKPELDNPDMGVPANDLGSAHLYGEGKEPELSRVKEKYLRQQARQFKKKDKEKSEKDKKWR